MKFVIAFLFCFVGIRAEGTTNRDNGDEDMITCLIENGLDPGIYNHRKLDTNLPTEDQKNCYLACMFKKIGYMKKDGTINVDVILSNAYAPERRAEGKRKLDEIVNRCKLQALLYIDAQYKEKCVSNFKAKNRMFSVCSEENRNSAFAAKSIIVQRFATKTNAIHILATKTIAVQTFERFRDF